MHPIKLRTLTLAVSTVLPFTFLDCTRAVDASPTTTELTPPQRIARNVASAAAKNNASSAFSTESRHIVRHRARANHGRTYRVGGRLRLETPGAEGRIILHVDGHGGYRSDINLGRHGWRHEVVHEDLAWVESNNHGPRGLRGGLHAQAIAIQTLVNGGDWWPLFDTVRLIGTEKVDGRAVHLLVLHADDVPRVVAEVDAKTGDVMAFETSVFDPDAECQVRVEVQLHDYREVNGIRIPFRKVESRPSGSTVFEVQSIETDVETNHRLFLLPDAFPPLGWGLELFLATWRP